MRILRRKELIISLLAILITYTLYAQILKHEFVNIDDHVYVTENLPVKTGLTLQGMQWAFVTFHAEFWHTLTWLSLMLDTQLYGVNSGGYLFTNLLLHLFNTLILFHVFNRATQNIWQSGFVAILFAIHPLHVESVAWISQRKDLLSTLFWLLTIWCYEGYIRKPGAGRYVAVSAFFVLGLMAKSMVITLPLVLLLMDYWPFQRVAGLRSHKTRPYLKLIAEKMPWMMISAAVGILTLVAQRSGAGLVSMDIFSMDARIFNALISYVVYICRMLWPLNLAVFYPFPTSFSGWQVAGSTAILIAVTLCAIRFRNGFPYLLMGWCWYLLTLTPVIGILKIGAFANADRYTYVPLIGLFVAVSWTMPAFVKKHAYGRLGLAITAVLIIVSLSAISNAQIKHWSNSRRLFTHAVEVTDANYFAHFSLGNILATEKDFAGAARHFEKADRFYPQNVIIKTNLARILALKGELKTAQEYLEKALRFRPAYPNAHYHLGLVLLAQLSYADAIDNIAKALIYSKAYQELNDHIPKNSPAHYHYGEGRRLEKAGNLDASMAAYKNALADEQNFYPALINLAKIYVTKAAHAEALTLLKISTSDEWLRRAWFSGFAQWELIKH
jgi:Tfp pilus assembly protein PilF